MRESRVLMRLVRLGVLGVAALAVVTLIGGAPVEATPCIGCIPSPGMPIVYCSDGNLYPNICVAQENCQYDCVAIVRQH